MDNECKEQAILKIYLVSLLITIFALTGCAEPEPPSQDIFIYVDVGVSEEHLGYLQEALEYYENVWCVTDTFKVYEYDFEGDYSQNLGPRSINIRGEEVVYKQDQVLSALASWVSYANVNYFAGRIAFDNNNDFTAREYKLIFVHELGHIFRLKHVDDSSNIMNDEISDLTSSDLTDDQIMSTKIFVRLDQ